MNPGFWWMIALLVVVAEAVLLWVLWRRSQVTLQSQDQRIGRNVRLYRQHLAQWQQALAEGDLEQPDYDALYNEAARQLLSDVQRLDAAPAQGEQRRKWLLLLVPVPLLALVLYQGLGAWPDWVIAQELAGLSSVRDEADYRQRLKTLHGLIERRMAERPEHIEYRLLLARYAMGQQNYASAAAHYGVLAELLPDDANVWGYFAQAEYLRAGRKVTPLVSSAIDKALQLDPFQKTVLGLQGVDAFERGDLKAAITAWEKLLVALGDDNESSALIRQGVDKARQQLAERGEAMPEEPGINVNVTVADTLPELDRGLTVFVYAKAASGPPMPLAVKRLQLRDLPARVRLDDSMAMMAQMRLSQFEEVVIGARVSLSGQPVAQKGDWQGETDPLRWKAQGSADVLIQEQVK